MLQQLTRVAHRRWTAKSIRGTLLAEFAPGERSATLYVAFCPPFERLPHVEVEVVDDSTPTSRLRKSCTTAPSSKSGCRAPATTAATRDVEFFAAERCIASRVQALPV